MEQELEDMPSREGDNLLSFIFHETGDAKNVDDNLGTDETLAYLTQLCSQGVAHLTQEPLKLANEHSKVLERTQELAFNNYHSFIKTSDCVGDVISEFTNVEKTLENVRTQLPLFADSTVNFADEAKTISKRWRETSLMLAKHPQLLEFLEIPQMMNTCVRNGCYEEALKLNAYVQRLRKKFGNSVPLIETVARDAEANKEIMVNLLLKELHSNIQLPTCLKVISYLRRMETFSDIDLKLKFLTSRDAWLQSLIAEIPNATPLFHLSKLIEINRVNLFDIATQYRAVFPPEDPITATSVRGYSVTVHSPLNSDKDFNDSAILSSWMLFKVESFLTALKSDLFACVDGEHFYPFDSLVDPCFYFGLSMSRIGADIRPQLVKIFGEAILRRFRITTSQAASRFKKSLESYSVQKRGKSVSAKDVETDEESSLQPPSSLSEFLPLANLCNDILSGLNEIRQMTPLSMAAQISQALNDALFDATRAVYKYFRTEETTLTEEDRAGLTRLCEQFAYLMLPHLQRCLATICPPTVLAKALGVSVLELNKIKRQSGNLLAQISVEEMQKHLQDILPLKTTESVDLEVSSSHQPITAES